MPGQSHTAIYTDNRSRKEDLAKQLLSGNPPQELSFLRGSSGELFSNARIAQYLDEEARHDHSDLKPEGHRNLATFSSGERRKALLDHLLLGSPDFLVLDNVFDNLDHSSREKLKSDLTTLSETVLIIQLLSRHEDILPFIADMAFLEDSRLTGYPAYRPAATLAEQEHSNNTAGIQLQ